MSRTLDGFPIQNSINFLPDKPDPKVNRWSYDKPLKVKVYDDSPEFRINMRPVTWKGRTIVVEYELFMGMIRDWIRGYSVNVPGVHKNDPMTKEEALDFAFSV